MKDLRLEPKRAWVTSGGLVAVTVSGRGIGFVRCGRERRFVWGRFVECFLVLARAPALVEISASGPFGARRWSLRLEPKADVTPRRVLSTGARRYPLPRGMRFRSVVVPRLKLLLPDQLA
jgi:hypothetical protein